MVCVVTALYILGFLLVVASLAVGIPVTRHALTRMEEGAKQLRGNELRMIKRLKSESHYLSLSADEQAEASRRINEEAADVTHRAAASIGVDYARGVRMGGDDSRTVANAVRYVARVNRPTAALALLGGLASTIASILSLYV